MKVISCERPIFTKDHCYKPYTRYIVSDYEAIVLLNQTPGERWTVSSFNPYERRYNGGDLSGKKVCIYRHTAFGDQLMISCVPRYLKTLYPDATIHLYCDADIRDMWDTNPFVGGAAIPIPIHFDVARAYDYHIFYEGMLENNGERDQNCCYDDFFGVIGIKPETVSPQFKVPFVQVRPKDYEWVKSRNLDLSGHYLVYHMSPANPNRCYPPRMGMEFIRRFLRKWGDWHVFLVGRGQTGRDDAELLCREDKRVTNLIDQTGSFRDLIPVVEKATLVVAPDSSVMHLAAAFPGPITISLWGVFDPHDRVAYYRKHRALFAPGVCPHAPCRNHEFQLPINDCRQARNFAEPLEYCCALSALQPDHIMNECASLLV